MKNVYLIMPQNALVEGKVLHLYNYDSKVKLTTEQVFEFYESSPPNGMKRKKGAVEWVGIEISDSDIIEEEYRKSKTTLSVALSADIESGGYTWQVRNSIDLQNIQDAIDEHNYAGLEPDVTQSFRMANNTWQDLTVDKFEKVLSDYRLRKKDIYNKYKAWTSGDMLEEFEV